MSKNDHLLSISWGEVALRARNKKSALRKALKLFVFVMKYSSCYSSLLREMRRGQRALTRTRGIQNTGISIKNK